MVTITNDGKLALAKRINGVDSVAAFTYMANGSGSTAESASQTALITENTANGSARAAATCSYVADYKARWVKEFAFSGSVTISEVAIFNAASGGTMLLRWLLSAAKSYNAGESVEITISLTVSQVTT